MKSILFVCKHNIFRSRIAEAYLRKINTEISISSGGIFAPGGSLPPIQRKIIEGLGIKLSRPKPISFTALLKTDIVVIVADDVPISLFEDKRYGAKEIIKWEIPDVPNGNKKEVEETIGIIKDKTENLNRLLKMR